MLIIATCIERSLSHIYFLVLPVITTLPIHPSDIKAVVGGSIVINCSFSGGRNKTLYIKKRSAKILCDNHHFIAPKTWQLRINNVTTDDGGHYKCYSLPSGKRWSCEQLNMGRIHALHQVTFLSSSVKVGGNYLGPLLPTLNLIPTWKSNKVPSKVWDESTYLFPNFNGATVEVWEWISNSTHTL